MTKPSLFITLPILAWLTASVLGFLAFGAYKSRPGGGGSPPDRWPSDAPIPLDRDLPTLLIFIHPRCPCSPASLAELEHLSARRRGRFAAHVITYRPEAWDDPGGRRGVDPTGRSPWDDRGGRLASRFGVETSGHVLLFEPSGRRVFSGGITIARGHRGENPGLDRLVAAIDRVRLGAASGPVFGCPVLAPVARRSGKAPR